MPSGRILVVDDDAAILELCQHILGAEGYFVSAAKRGDEALAKMESEPFDLLLTDIRLPGLDGLEVTRRLRERGLELPVVTMTGYSNMEMAIQALSLGVAEFLVKPFTVEGLRLTVRRAVEKQHLHCEVERLRTLVPLLKTAQQLARARTDGQVREILVEATRLLVKSNDVLIVERARPAPGWQVTCSSGALLAPFGEVLARGADVPDMAQFLPAEGTVWNENDAPRLRDALHGVSWMVSVPLGGMDELDGFLIAAVEQPPSRSDVEALCLAAVQGAAALDTATRLKELKHELEDFRARYPSVE